MRPSGEHTRCRHAATLDISVRSLSLNTHDSVTPTLLRKIFMEDSEPDNALQSRHSDGGIGKWIVESLRTPIARSRRSNRGLKA